MLEKKHLVFLPGATAPFAPPLCTALQLTRHAYVDEADLSTEARVQICQTKSHKIVVNSFNFVYTFSIKTGFAFAGLYTLFIAVYTFFYTWQHG